jgi:hypothetical protein
MPVKQEKYSVKIQMILSVIPFVNLWQRIELKNLDYVSSYNYPLGC